MADQEHLKILKRGVEAWNRWRRKNREIQPNLVWANLIRADLHKANLSGADLTKALLSDANLSEAKLCGANFSEAGFFGANLDHANLNGANLELARLSSAKLRGANLSDANLRRAVLFDANLSEAKLCGAKLIEVNFCRADLRNTDFTDSVMGEAKFLYVNLSPAKGLEAVRHFGRSSIDIGTVYRSQGNIPEVFLRGCGVPEPFIVNMKSLVAAMKPIDFYSCFISHSSRDQEFAERLHSDLQSKGVRCWFAPEDLKIGDKLRASFDEAIRLHDKLMVILSEESVKSAWVEKEVETAFEKERRQGRTVLFPIRLDEAIIETKQAWAADIRRTRHIGDFCDWKNHDSYKKAFDRLLRDLKTENKAESAAPR